MFSLCLSVHRGGGVPCSLVPGFWSQVLSWGKGDTSVSGPRSLPGGMWDGVPLSWSWPGGGEGGSGYPVLVGGGTLVTTSTWVLPLARSRTGVPRPPAIPGQGYLPPPGQDQDRGIPFLDTTRYGQDAPRAVRLLRSRRRTFLLWLILK